MTQFSGWQQQTSNKNLLINPRFKVNQRGKTEYMEEGYCIDGWYIFQGYTGTISKINNGIKINANAETDCILEQKIEDDLLNKLIVFSISTEGLVYSQVKIVDTKDYIDAIQINGASIRCYSENGVTKIRIWVITGNEITIQAVKLELGTISTLAQDLAQPYTPQDYQRELRECQRYLQVVHSTTILSGSVNTAGNSLDVLVPLSTPMRILPSIQNAEFLEYRFSDTVMAAAPTSMGCNFGVDCSYLMLYIFDSFSAYSKKTCAAVVKPKTTTLLSAEL